MLGGEDAALGRLAASAGIVPRLSRELFALLDAERDRQGAHGAQFLVSASFLEIYNEVLYDLLGNDSGGGVRAGGGSERRLQPLEIRESAATGVRVHGLAEVPVSSERDLLRVVSSGHRRRATSSTAMNARSSRSHAIVAVDVLRKEADGRELRARLSLVDLAGSERTGQMLGGRRGEHGGQFKEGVAINKSLSALGAVINALAAADGSFVPYRNSKLTRVLQGSLGGNSLTAMIGTLSTDPACAEDSLSTLQYAERAKLIPVHAVANEAGAGGAGGGAGGGAEARALRAQVRALQAELAKAAGGEASDPVSRQLRQRLDEAQFELLQTFDEKERVQRELASARRANAEERRARRRARRAERELARGRLLRERMHGHWLRALALSEPLWLRALPQLPAAAAAAQLRLSEAEVRFCQQRSFLTSVVGALGEQAAQLHALQLEAQERAAAGAGADAAALTRRRSALLTPEHSQLHTLRQVALKLDGLHGESARGHALRAQAEGAYSAAFALLEDARAQLAARSAAALARGWQGAEGDGGEDEDEEDDDDEHEGDAEACAEGLLDIACARQQLSDWRAQLLSAGAQGSQLLVCLSELCTVLLAALQAHRARLAQRPAGRGLDDGDEQHSCNGRNGRNGHNDPLEEQLAEATRLGGAVRAHLADIAPGARGRQARAAGGSPSRGIVAGGAGGEEDLLGGSHADGGAMGGEGGEGTEGAVPPELLGLLSAPVHGSLLQLVRAVEAAISDELRHRASASASESASASASASLVACAARGNDGAAAAQPCAVPSAVPAPPKTPAGRASGGGAGAVGAGMVGDGVRSAALRRAARQRQRQAGEADEQAVMSSQGSAAQARPPALFLRSPDQAGSRSARSREGSLARNPADHRWRQGGANGLAAAGGNLNGGVGGGEALRSLAGGACPSSPEGSTDSEGGLAHVAALEEQLQQAQQRLHAAEGALERSTHATRELAARFAEADAERAALAQQLEAQAVENDDLWREAATLRAELLEANDSAALFLHWLSQARDNLGTAAAAGGGAADTAAGGAGEADEYSAALKDAFQLVEAKFLLYLKLVPLQAHTTGGRSARSGGGGSSRGGGGGASPTSSIPSAGTFSKARRAFSALFPPQSSAASPAGSRASSRAGSHPEESPSRGVRAPSRSASAGAAGAAGHRRTSSASGGGVPWLGKARSADVPAAHAGGRADEGALQPRGRSSSQPPRRLDAEAGGGGDGALEDSPVGQRPRMSRIDSQLDSDGEGGVHGLHA